MDLGKPIRRIYIKPDEQGKPIPVPNWPTKEPQKNPFITPKIPQKQPQEVESAEV